MGAAVYGMHYTGMLAARFDHAATGTASMQWSILGNSSLVVAVTMTTFMILAIAAIGAITDRRMRAGVAEASRRTSDLLRAMIEDSPEAIIATDLEFRVTRWNTAATTLLGWDAHEMTGSLFSEVLPEGERERDADLRRSALQAIASYQANREEIRLVITDMMMPGMGGYEVEAVLKDIDPSLRILFISGYSPEALERHGAAIETSDFLSKPFGSESLTRKVREMLDAR
jgi:PAS domain-containing protein